MSGTVGTSSTSIYSYEMLIWIAEYIQKSLKENDGKRTNRNALIAAFNLEFKKSGISINVNKLAGIYTRHGRKKNRGMRVGDQKSFVDKYLAIKKRREMAEKSPQKPIAETRPVLKREMRIPRAKPQAEPRTKPQAEPKAEPQAVQPEREPEAPKQRFVPAARITQDPAELQSLKRITDEEDDIIAFSLGNWHPDRVKGSPFGYASIAVNRVRVRRPLASADDIRAHVIGTAPDARKAVEAFLNGNPAFAKAHAGKSAEVAEQSAEVAERVAAYKPRVRDR